mgnify:CR=1 FL=1
MCRTRGQQFVRGVFVLGRGIRRPILDRRRIVPAMGVTQDYYQPFAFDWARLDCAAMIDALPRPLYWIGHSLGGQILPSSRTRTQ